MIADDRSYRCFRIKKDSVLSQNCFQVQATDSGRLPLPYDRPTAHLRNIAEQNLMLLTKKLGNAGANSQNIQTSKMPKNHSMISA